MSTKKESHRTDISSIHPSSDKNVFWVRRSVVRQGPKTPLKNLWNNLYVNLEFIILLTLSSSCANQAKLGLSFFHIGPNRGIEWVT